jgi:hypothetical protein
LVGKLALHIWNEKWDKSLFKTVQCGSIFLSMLNALTNEDPKKRPSIASVLDIFTSLRSRWNCQIVASAMRFRVVGFV